MKIDNLHLYDYLSLNNLVSKSKLEDFFKQAQTENIQLSRLLVEEKIFSQSQMLRIIASVLGLKFVDLANVKISNEVLNLIPRKLAHQFLAVAFEKEGDFIKVAVCDPEISQLFNFLKRKNHLNVEFYLAEKKLIKKSLLEYIQKITLANESENLVKEIEDKKIDKEEFVIRTIDVILSQAISDLASEIQIEKKKENVVVQYRIEGNLIEKISLPEKIFPEMLEVIKILARLNLEIKNFYQSGSFTITKNSIETFFQVTIIPNLFSEKISIRLDDNQNDNWSLEKIGLVKKNIETIYQTLQKNKKLTIFTSPIKGGKTTTFYTILGLLNFSDKNIYTIESFIDKKLNKINQIKVDTKNGITFKTGLNSIIDQDADIIGVDEILDEATLEIVFNISAGKLILATIYGNSVLETIQNIYNLGMNLKLVSENLELIIAQKLVRKLCVHCREKYFLSEAELSDLKKKYDLVRMEKIIAERNDFEGEIDFLKIPFYKSRGCDKCGKLGYIGELGIFEVLKLSDSVKKLIAQKENLEKIRETILSENFETMLDDAFHKVIQGVTDFEEIKKLDLK